MEGTYRPSPARGKVAAVLLLLMGLLAVVTAVHFFMGFDLADRAARSALRSDDATAFDNRTQTLSQLAVVGSILTALAWFLWLHRSVANARSLGVTTEATPGWSVGWWFVPFANLVKPYRILRSLFDGVGSGGGGIVGAWWGCYLIAAVVGEFAAFQSSPTPDAFRIYAASFLGSAVFRIAAALLAALMVWSIDEGVASLAQTRATPSPALLGSPAEAMPR
jgi:Domain of unknown function (DUF4328)